MASEGTKMLKAAHSPAARKKAIASMSHLAELRQKLAAKYDTGSVQFTKPHLLATVKRLNIPLSAIPADLFKPFGVTVRKELLAKRAANGHDHACGIGIPLDAIPAKAERKPNARGAYTAKRGHPNAELIGKVIDLLARPDIEGATAERLLTALDKLMV